MCADSKLLLFKFILLCSLYANYIYIFTLFNMRVHLIKWKSVEDFVSAHARSKVSFEIFKEKVKHADWESINDIQNTFNSADTLKNNRIVFNIGGNNYRMICSYWFGPKMVHLYLKPAFAERSLASAGRWIGTHAEYTKLCNNNLQYTIDEY